MIAVCDNLCFREREFQMPLERYAHYCLQFYKDVTYRNILAKIRNKATTI